MREEILTELCRKLHLGMSFAEKALNIPEKTNLEFLSELLTLEIEDRDRKRRNAYIIGAKFDIIKTFENYDFNDIKFPENLSVNEVLNAEFVSRKENLILYGNVGAGKTHMAIATGISACDKGFKTRFYRTATLVNSLTEAKRNGEFSKFMKQIEKCDLLICDEWGYVPIDKEGTKLLFEVIAQCYERKALIITTNLEFTHWNDIFADAKITAALLDRIIHHSHLLDFTKRPSRRLSDALQGKSKATG